MRNKKTQYKKIFFGEINSLTSWYFSPFAGFPLTLSIITQLIAWNKAQFQRDFNQLFLEEWQMRK